MRRTLHAKYGLPLNVLFCKRCVVSNQRPASAIEYQHTAGSRKETIHFDAEGVCDACRVAEKKASIDWTAREEELRELLAEYRSKDGSYDCIVPGSGGKDSFYAAHVLKRTYGMHPLLVTWAPHMATDWGRRNLERWQEIADHILVTPNRMTHRLLTRLAVENLFHPFQPFIVGQKSVAAKLAVKHGIELVFYGESEAEYGDPKSKADKSKRHSAYHSQDGGIHLSGVPEAELRGKYGLTTADLDPYMPLRGDEALEVDVRYLGYYLRWRPQHCYYYAVENGGFEAAPERTPGTWSKYSSIDDKIDDYHYLTTYIKFGIGRATYDAAQEVRSGEITRDEGVSLVKKFDGEYPSRFESEVFEYLSVPGLSPMTKDYFWSLADKFRSPHLWEKKDDQWLLRNTVWNCSGEK